MASTPKSILVLGAGELGTAVITALSTHPALSSVPITLAVRPSSVADPARATSYRQIKPALSLASLDLSAPTAESDLTDLVRSGAHDVVIVCTGYTSSGSGSAEEGTQHLVARAVLAAGPLADGTSRRFFPWQFGVDYDAIAPDAAGGLMAEQMAVRKLLRERAEAAGVEWTIVSTGMFMSFVFEDWFGVVEGLGGALKEGVLKEGKVKARGLGGWGNKVTLTAVEDIGTCVASVVASVPDVNDQGGRIVYIAGQTVRYDELADILDRVLENKVTREEWTVAFLDEELAKNPGDQISRYRVLFGGGTGMSWEVDKTLNVERGIKTVGVEAWLRGRLGLE